MKSGVPLVIVGAGRSGTNFLSHVFEHDDRFWNAYESRYIWNYGQKTLTHDVRKLDEATAKVRQFIGRYFEQLSHKHDGRWVVDKTPSNVFRVGFVHEVFPDAKIIHIIRDGRDNIVSRVHEWYGGRAVNAQRERGKEASYRLALIRQRFGHLRTLVARGNLPAARWPTFLWDNVSTFSSHFLTGRPRRYAERFPGMDDCLGVYGLMETAAIQWREGVMRALCEGRRLPAGSYLEVRYEDLLSSPETQWDRIVGFLGIEEDRRARDWLLANARRDNFGKWKRQLSDEAVVALEPHVRPTLEFLGYSWEA